MATHLVHHAPRDYEMAILVFKLSQYSLSPSIPASVPLNDLQLRVAPVKSARRFEPTHVWKVRGDAHVQDDVMKFIEELRAGSAVGWFQAATGLGKSTWLLLRLASMAKVKIIVVSPFEQLIRFTGAYVRTNKDRKGFHDVKVRVHHLPVKLSQLTDVNYISAMTLLVTVLRYKNFVEDHGPMLIYIDEAHVDTPEYRCLKIAASSGFFGHVAIAFSTATPDGLPSAEVYRGTEVSTEVFDAVDINADPARSLSASPVARERLTGKVLVFAADYEHALRLYEYYKRQDVYVAKFDEQMTNTELVEVLTQYSKESGSRFLITTFVLETGYTLDVDVVVDFSLKPDIGYDGDKGIFFHRLRPVYPFEATQRAGRAGRIGPKAKVYRMKVGNVVDRGYGYLRLFRVYAWLALMGLRSSLDEMVPVAKAFGKYTARKLWNVLNCALPPVLTLQYLDGDGLPYSSLVPQLLNFYPKGWRFDCENQSVPRYVVEKPFQRRLPHTEETVPLPLSSENYFSDVMVWFELGRTKPVTVKPIPGFGGDGLDSDLMSRVGSDVSSVKPVVRHRPSLSFDEEVQRVGRNSLPQRNQSRVSFRPRQSLVSQFQVPHLDDVMSVQPSIPEERSPILYGGHEVSVLPPDYNNNTAVDRHVEKSRMVEFQMPWYVVVDIRRARDSFVFPYIPLPAFEDLYHRPNDGELEMIRSLARGERSVSDGTLSQIEMWFFALVKVWNLSVVDQRQFEGQAEEPWTRLRVQRVQVSRTHPSSRKWSLSRRGVRVSFEDMFPLFSAMSVYGFRPCVPVRGYHSPFTDPVGWLTDMLGLSGVRVNHLPVSDVDETGATFTHLMDYSVLHAIKYIHCVRAKVYVQCGFALGSLYHLGDYVYILKHIVSGIPGSPYDELMLFRRGDDGLDDVEQPIVRKPVIGERAIILCANPTIVPRLEVEFEGAKLPIYAACTVRSVRNRMFRVNGRSEGGLSGSPVIAASDAALLGFVHGMDIVTAQVNVCSVFS